MVSKYKESCILVTMLAVAFGFAALVNGHTMTGNVLIGIMLGLGLANIIFVLMGPDE